MHQFFLFAMAFSGSVSGLDPPEFVVEDEGDYVISVAWQAYPSDLWVDGYLIVNGKSIETFHGLVQKYIEESIDSFPPYISSYNSFPHLTSGDVVWIHSEQTDQLENTRIVVQKSAADMREAFKLNR